MRRRVATGPSSDWRQALFETFVANERMNQLVLAHLDPEIWTAKPPGRGGRTIAAIFTHVHNIRVKWLRLSVPGMRPPASLHRTRCTQKQAEEALAESGRRCAEMIARGLGLGAPRVARFHRDGWARPWPAGVAMVVYMISHEAHHRGQVLMQAHQLGHALPDEARYGVWNWDRLWRECGFGPPR